MSEDMGYTEHPTNRHGIKRVRTTGMIRSWEIPRSTESLKVLGEELGETGYPSVYLLFEKSSKVYVGEAKNILNRLETHNKTPGKKIGDWDKVIIINDGRSASQSDFNDSVVRKSLESYLIGLFETNKYKVVAQGEPQNLNSTQTHLVNTFKKELLFLFKRKNLITKDVELMEEREVFPDELKRILIKSGKRIDNWKEKESIIDGEKFFIRQGSKKPRGYQITIRGRKPGSFIDCLKRGVGNLLVRRDGVLVIPLKKIQDVIKDKETYEQDTVDIYITFSENKALLNYKENSIDITNYKLVK